MEAKNNADKIEGILEDFNDGTIDNIVDDNTLVFAENDEETLRKAREAREKEIMERVGLAKKEAEAIVSSAKDLYGKSTSDVSYVQFKAKADADSLGKILFQVYQMAKATVSFLSAEFPTLQYPGQSAFMGADCIICLIAQKCRVQQNGSTSSLLE